jgi:HK97 family phage major capsid protein
MHRNLETDAPALAASPASNAEAIRAEGGKDREACMRPAQDQTRGVMIVGGRFQRSATLAQITARRATEPLVRHGEVRSIDQAARTVELAFSSETPVDRWFGDEVLVHDAGAMRTDRLDGGAPLLVDHDHRNQVGVIESARIDGDRIGRALVRFGRSARAEEIFADVVDGIRKHVSVGYSIDKIEITPRNGMSDLVRVTEWTPYEISIVSVPADASVGVGRAAPAPGNPPEDREPAVGEDEATANPGASRAVNEDRTMNTKILRDAEGNLVRAKVDDAGKIIEILEVLERAGADMAHARGEGESRSQQRVAAIMTLGREYDALELAAQFIETGKSPEDFQRALLAHVNQRGGNRPLAAGDAAAGATTGDADGFRFLRLFQAAFNPTDARAQRHAALELDLVSAATERARLSGRSAKGLLIPPEVLMRALNTDTAGGAAGDTGGFSIATELLSESFVEMLRNRTIAMQLGTPLGGLVGNVDIPRQTGGATAYWLDEDADSTESALDMDQVSMAPKTISAHGTITRKLLQQSSIDIEGLVRRDLASTLAIGIDRGFFYGSGSANQPLGLRNLSGLATIDFGGAGSGGGVLLPTFAEVVAMETEISASNADVNSMAYVADARMRGHWKTTEKFAGAAGSTVWEQGNTVNGYRTEITNQIASGETFFGNFADALIGMWGGLDILVDPYSLSQKGRLRITMFQDVDFVFRRAESFCRGIDLT